MSPTVDTTPVPFESARSLETWLEIVGEKKWIVLTRDKMIGRRKLQLDALFNAKVKAFVLVTDDLTDTQNAEIIKNPSTKFSR